MSEAKDLKMMSLSDAAVVSMYGRHYDQFRCCYLRVLKRLKEVTDAGDGGDGCDGADGGIRVGDAVATAAAVVSVCVQSD